MKNGHWANRYMSEWARVWNEQHRIERQDQQIGRMKEQLKAEITRDVLA